MAINSDMVTVLSIVVVAFTILRWLEHRWGHRIGEPDPKLYEEKINDLQRQLIEQRRQYEERIDELEERIRFLVEELQRAGIHIRDLEKNVAETVKAKATITTPLLPKPLLLICAMETKLCDIDRHAVRRASVSFQRLFNATKHSIIAELRRRRQDNTLYPWLHIAAHATEQGIELLDGTADPSWWNEQLDGINVVLLAACKSAAVADALAGMATVVFVLEDIEHSDAADFTYSFWRRMKEHGDPRLAYQQAIIDVPQIAEYTDIRTG